MYMNVDIIQAYGKLNSSICYMLCKDKTIELPLHKPEYFVVKTTTNSPNIACSMRTVGTFHNAKKALDYIFEQFPGCEPMCG